MVASGAALMCAGRFEQVARAARAPGAEGHPPTRGSIGPRQVQRNARRKGLGGPLAEDAFTPTVSKTRQLSFQQTASHRRLRKNACAPSRTPAFHNFPLENCRLLLSRDGVAFVRVLQRLSLRRSAATREAICVASLANKLTRRLSARAASENLCRDCLAVKEDRACAEKNFRVEPRLTRSYVTSPNGPRRRRRQ
jgi:hypothetical protein